MPDREPVRERERASGSVDPPETESYRLRPISTVVCETSRAYRSDDRSGPTAAAATTDGLKTSCASQAW